MSYTVVNIDVYTSAAAERVSCARVDTCEKCRHSGAVFSTVTLSAVNHGRLSESTRSVGTAMPISAQWRHRQPIPCDLAAAEGYLRGIDGHFQSFVPPNRQWSDRCWKLIGSSHSLTFGRSISFSIIILSPLTLRNSIASSRFKLYTRLSSDV